MNTWFDLCLSYYVTVILSKNISVFFKRDADSGKSGHKKSRMKRDFFKLNKCCLNFTSCCSEYTKKSEGEENYRINFGHAGRCRYGCPHEVAADLA